jgi:serine/threonine protein kinase
MVNKVLFDIPRLTERIKALAATYTPSRVDSTTNTESLAETGLYRSLKGFIRNAAIMAQAQDPAYWKSGGIRMIPNDDITDCMRKAATNSKVLGQGFYGRVLNVQSGPCFKTIPVDVKHFGLKIENLKPDWDPNQVPKRLREVTEIAKEAGELGIGPAFYDVFVTTDKLGSVQIIKAFEVIDGTSWRDTKWASSKQKEKAVEQLDKAIHVMNKAGIIHHDLHQGNVMVSKKGKVYIIDYDLARRTDNEETERISMFANNHTDPWEPPGVASRKGCLYLFKRLIDEGSIKLTATKSSSRKTRRSKRPV